MDTYYGELCTRMYESDKSIAEGKELDFYLSFVTDNMKVLEPMCGNGRMLIPFMQKGIDIEGFDMSEEMLKACEVKAEKLNLNPKVHLAKLEEFRGVNKYDLIMIPFGSFSLLPNDLVNRGLANLKASLKKEGKLLLTVMTKKGVVGEIPEWTETDRKHFGEEVIVVFKKSHYDLERKMLVTMIRYQLEKDGDIVKTENMNFPLRLYEQGEFEQILYSTGFQSIVLHDVVDGYGVGSFFQVFECAL